MKRVLFIYQSGTFSFFRYKLKTKSPYFDINKYDGRIVVKRSLEGVDFDTIKLDVVAEDQGGLLVCILRTGKFLDEIFEAFFGDRINKIVKKRLHS